MPGRPTVLHVTAHMGGGAGRFLAELALREKDGPFCHRILLLQPPEKRLFFESCLRGGVEALVCPSLSGAADEIARADLVLLHWWHHPAMARLLGEFPPVPVRTLLWVLLNGCTYPALPFPLCQCVDKILFSTPYTFDNPLWSAGQRQWARENALLCYPSALSALEKRPGRGPEPTRKAGQLRVGYSGTLAQSKLHPDFLLFCRAVLGRVPNAHFVLVGDSDGGALQARAKELGIDGHIELAGFVEDMGAWLESFDIFGYLLNPTHFGSAENALLEAMAAGLPVVALRQGCEQYTIEHGVSGLLVESPAGYAQAIAALAASPQERARLGQGARERMAGAFHPVENYRILAGAFDALLKAPKRRCGFGPAFGAGPASWFLSCLGEDRPLFARSLSPTLSPGERRRVKDAIRACKPILRGESKSSVRQFARFFPQDKALQYWLSLLG